MGAYQMRDIMIKQKLTKGGINALTAPFRWIIVTGIVYFLSAGALNITRVWLYIAIYIFGSALIGILLMRKSISLLNDRGEIKEGTKFTDKIIITLYFVFAIIITPLVAGFDCRYNNQFLPFYFFYIGVLFYLLSAVFSIWPMYYNPFFEGTVRIQKDKNHKVIKSGPYKIIRHPGYLGMFLGSFPIPFAFGSKLSFYPVGIMLVLVIIRTYYEDKILRKELSGYIEYCEEVKYRLLPFIW